MRLRGLTHKNLLRVDDQMIAVIRIRGISNINPAIKMTLEMLRLNRPNHCVVVHESPAVNGMLAKVKDYVAFGEVSEEVLFRLLLKRGEKDGKALREVKNEDEIRNIAKEITNGRNVGDYLNPVFRLHPPDKGYKNIKMHWPAGELGQRGSIDDLLKRMM